MAAFLSADASDDPVKRDKNKLKGRWVATEVVAGGKKQDVEIRFDFDGDKVTMTVKGKPAESNTFSIDPAKAPANIDFVIERQGNKITLPALYQLKDDQFTICHPFTESGDRPMTLEATAKTVLITFRRQNSQDSK